MSGFAALNLIEPLLRAVAAEGYTSPTPIQLQAIPPVLAGRDLLGCAQTGTGKTAAFVLPILQRLAAEPAVRGRRPTRALILSPTRELAAQIGERVGAYGVHLNLRHAVIFGGVGQGAQVDALRAGVDVLVACPGRMLDLLGQGHVDLSEVRVFVLDEADRMLDMGFVHDVKKVLRVLPAKRQNLLFSATMPAAIVELANSFLHAPVHVEVTPQSTTVERIVQSVRFVSKADKRKALTALLSQPGIERAIVFSRTKHGANRLVTELEKANFRAAALHGNKSQNARLRALNGFTDGTIPVLVATDVAARGLDVDGISHVINFDLPNEPEVYVHRIGRTGRAGADGIAISLCEPEEGEYLRDIERLIGMEVPVDDAHPFHDPSAVPPPGRWTGPRTSMQARNNAARSAERSGGGRSGGGGGGRDGGGRDGGGRDGGGRSGGGRSPSAPANPGAVRAAAASLAAAARGEAPAPRGNERGGEGARGPDDGRAHDSRGPERAPGEGGGRRRRSRGASPGERAPIAPGQHVSPPSGGQRAPAPRPAAARPAGGGSGPRTGGGGGGSGPRTGGGGGGSAPRTGGGGGGSAPRTGGGGGGGGGGGPGGGRPRRSRPA